MRCCVLRSAADHCGGSGLPEARIPPHPQRQGSVRDRQSRGGVQHSRHLSWDVQTLMLLPMSTVVSHGITGLSTATKF